MQILFLKIIIISYKYQNYFGAKTGDGTVRFRPKSTGNNLLLNKLF